MAKLWLHCGKVVRFTAVIKPLRSGNWPLGRSITLLLLDFINSQMRNTRKFTKNNDDAYSGLEFKTTTSEIKNPDGTIVFSAPNIEVPANYSQVAADIIAQKYFRKAGVPQADGTSGRETTVKQVAHRMLKHYA